MDTAPLVPFINGLLPVPPPDCITLPIVHVRYDAITSPPLRPAPPTAHLPPVISAFSYVKLFLTYVDFLKKNT